MAVPTKYYGVTMPSRRVFVSKDGGGLADLFHVKQCGEVFDWGTHGPGSLALANSILAHVIEVPAVNALLYRAFMFDFLVGLPADKSWILTEISIREWLSKRWSSMSDVEIREDLSPG